MPRPIVWISILIALNLFWAGSYTVAKFGTQSMDPLTLVFLRLSSSFVILAAWVLYRRYSLRVGFRDFARIAAAGVLTGLSHWLVVTGINVSHATDASLLYVFEPLWGILLAGIFLRERVGVTAIIALVVVIAGLGRLSNFDLSAFGFAGGAMGFGNVLIVVGLFCESLFSIILKPVARRRPASLVMAIELFIASAALAVPMAGRLGEIPAIGLDDLFVISYLTLICTVIAYTAWVRVMRHVPVNVMLFSIFVQPITGPIIARVALGEPIDSRVVTGGAILIVGMSIAIIGHLKNRGRGICIPADNEFAAVAGP